MCNQTRDFNTAHKEEMNGHKIRGSTSELVVMKTSGRVLYLINAVYEVRL